jgi:hypothetical protein
MRILIICLLLLINIGLSASVNTNDLKTDTIESVHTSQPVIQKDDQTFDIALISNLATAFAAIIALIAFIFNVVRNRIEEKKSRERELLLQVGELNLYTYLMSWMSLTQAYISDFKRKLVLTLKENLKNTNDVNEIIELLQNTGKMEVLIESTWHDSIHLNKIENLLEKITNAENFISIRFPFMSNLINDFTGKLRNMYLLDAHVQLKLKDPKQLETIIKSIKSAKNPSDSLEEAIFELIDSAKYNEKGFSQHIIQQFQAFCLQLKSNKLLQLSSFACKVHKTEMTEVKKLKQVHKYILKRFQQTIATNFSTELAKYIEYILQNDENYFVNFLRYLIDLKVDDPDVEMFLAVIESDSDNLKKSMAKGANIHITNGELKERYKDTWKTFILE